MLPTSQPAKFIPFLYNSHIVRFHLHTEDSSVWIKNVHKVLFMCKQTI